MGTLLAHDLRRSLPAAAAIFSVMALYTVCIVYMFNPDTARMLDELMAVMPDLYDAFGMGHDTTTLTGFVLNYLYGFILTLLPLVLVLLVVNALLVRPIARGEFAYVLASPHGRGAILATVAGACAIVLVAVLAAVHATELASVLALFPDDLDAGALAAANAGLLCLWVFMAGVCLLSAVAFAKRPGALWVGGGFCLVEFVVQMASQLGGDLDILRSLTFFSLFDPYGLVAGEAGAVAGAAALLGLGLACGAGAVLVFCRRDLAL